MRVSCFGMLTGSQCSFWAARNATGPAGPGLGMMERQRLKMWMGHAYAALGAVDP